MIPLWLIIEAIGFAVVSASMIAIVITMHLIGGA